MTWSRVSTSRGARRSEAIGDRFLRAEVNAIRAAGRRQRARTGRLLMRFPRLVSSRAQKSRLRSSPAVSSADALQVRFDLALVSTTKPIPAVAAARRPPIANCPRTPARVELL